MCFFLKKPITHIPPYESLPLRCCYLWVNAINSCLNIGRFNINLSSQLWHISMYSNMHGHRNKNAILLYKKTLEKSVQALHLCISIIRRGGSIYVVFDREKFMQTSSNLDKFLENKKGLRKTLMENLYKPRPCRASVAPDYKNVEKRCLPQDKKQFYKKRPCSQAVPCRNVNPSFNFYKNKNQTFKIPFGISSQKWVSGTFSNFQQISKSVYLYGTLARQFFKILQTSLNFSSRYNKISKYNGNIFTNLYNPENSSFKGCFKLYPQCIIIENAEKHKNVISEAKGLGIPIIAFGDSNSGISDISILLPLNLHKKGFLNFLLYTVSKIHTLL